ncbi:ImmA/IrrE family metallo-endopeptidase, partial [Salinivibrio sp. VYel6]|uniref:ImmA/IrrE family metallo-endopeptidase n=1 Tax=Salinivibrio sp. VYel6 TaxID=2490493 RepID=UPI00128CD694
RSIHPFANSPEDLSGLSGYAEVQADGTKLAYVNSRDSVNRQRFTLAHEIGHHVLGHVTPGSGKMRDYPGSFSSNSIRWEEIEANNFAAELLMPEEAVKYMVYHQAMSSIEELARAFQVSEVAMHYRLTNLGIIHASHHQYA